MLRTRAENALATPRASRKHARSNNIHSSNAGILLPRTSSDEANNAIRRTAYTRAPLCCYHTPPPHPPHRARIFFSTRILRSKACEHASTLPWRPRLAALSTLTQNARHGERATWRRRLASVGGHRAARRWRLSRRQGTVCGRRGRFNNLRCLVLPQQRITAKHRDAYKTHPRVLVWRLRADTPTQREQNKRAFAHRTLALNAHASRNKSTSQTSGRETYRVLPADVPLARRFTVDAERIPVYLLVERDNKLAALACERIVRIFAA